MAEREGGGLQDVSVWAETEWPVVGGSVWAETMWRVVGAERVGRDRVADCRR